MGVTSILVNNGVNLGAFQKGLTEFSKTVEASEKNKERWVKKFSKSSKSSEKKAAEWFFWLCHIRFWQFRRSCCIFLIVGQDVYCTIEDNSNSVDLLVHCILICLNEMICACIWVKVLTFLWVYTHWPFGMCLTPILISFSFFLLKVTKYKFHVPNLGTNYYFKWVVTLSGRIEYCAMWRHFKVELNKSLRTSANKEQRLVSKCLILAVVLLEVTFWKAYDTVQPYKAGSLTLIQWNR